MNISLHKKILGDAVAAVSRFAERKIISLPALSGIALEAKRGEVVLRATNLETGIQITIDADVSTPGTVAIPAGVFRDITASFSGDGIVKLEQKGETVVLTTDKGKSTIKTLSYEDVPTLGIPEQKKTSLTLPGSVFKSLISTVAPYASVSTVRPELASVFLSAEGGMIKAVATDSFRLAEKKVSVPGVVPQFSALIPAKNALEIIQNIPDTEVSFVADEHQCAFVYQNGVAVTRLVSMSYPDYAQIIPKTFSAEATLLKKDFEAALKRTAVFSDSFQKIKLAIDPKNKVLGFSARNTDIGETSEDINISATGEALELSFNHRYLSAPLSGMNTESMTLSAAGIGRPLVIRGAGDTSFLYLVMPMNQ